MDWVRFNHFGMNIIHEHPECTVEVPNIGRHCKFVCTLVL